MSQNLSNWYSLMFSGQVRKLAGQEDSYLRKYTVPVTNKEAEQGFLDSIGRVRARKVTGISEPIQPTNIDHKRRRIDKQEFEVTLYIPERQVESVISDPRSLYAQRVVEALNVEVDRVIVEAALADVWVGQKGETLINASADGVLVVDATGGLTVAKFNEINENFIDNSVLKQGGQIRRILPITGSEHTSAMGQTQLTSGDYTHMYPNDTGEIQRAMGIDFIKYGANEDDPVLPVEAGVRRSFCMAEGAIALWVSNDIQCVFEKRPDLHKTWQVQATCTIGAVRQEGAFIQEVRFTA